MSFDFKAAVFDMDGTLLDSMHLWEKIDIDFLSKRNLEVPSDYVTKVAAKSLKEAADYTISAFKLKESREEIMAEWHNMAFYEYSNNIRLKKYAYEYLKLLSDKGIKLGIATGLSEKLCDAVLKNNDIYGMFDVVCSVDHAGKGKESPDVYLLVAERLNIAPCECIMFEDVLAAARNAKLAGMYTVGVYDSRSESFRAAMEKELDLYIEDFRFAPKP